MKKDLSAEAQDFLSWLDKDTLIEPDDWHFHISAGGNRLPCTPQLKRDLIRKTLVEINEYKPNFLSPVLKKDWNLIRRIGDDDLIPSGDNLSRLRNKLEELAEDGQVKFDVECLKKDPDRKMVNTIVSAWMIDIRDVIDFINGEEIETIYRRVVKRRKVFDRPS